MPDSFSRKVYLRSLDTPALPARFSSGAQRRTVQLQGFLSELQASAVPLAPTHPPELLVISKSDWRTLFSYPYGLPFTRTTRGNVSIVAAATYPERLLHRFNDVLVRAAQEGEAVPGDLREFLDLLIGHEWGHAVANLSGLRTRVKWVDEFVATYLFLLALREMGAEDVLERFLAWARLEVAGSGVTRAPLGTFEYPRMKLRFTTMLWFQGMFTLRAAELARTRGWDFPLAFREAFDGGDRGDVARTLVEVEPSFREWFVVFGVETE